MDDSQTVIDGGHIATSSITANSLDASSINASNILTVGAFSSADADTQSKIFNDGIKIGTDNLLRNTSKFCATD